MFEVCQFVPPSKLYCNVNPVTADGPFVISSAVAHVFAASGVDGVDG